MSSSNEGLVIGKNDGSSSMLFSPKWTNFNVSSRVEVMYISQCVIPLRMVSFLRPFKLGGIVEEQYHINPDMNVIRYVDRRKYGKV